MDEPINPYKVPNMGRTFTLLKQAIKDCDRGALSREEFALILRHLADTAEERKPEYGEQLTMDEVVVHIKDHLARNKMGQHGTHTR